MTESVLSHAKNDYVMYKSAGICEIYDIITETFRGMEENTYYVLKPVYDSRSLLYVPVNAKSLSDEMRHILSADEINEIIDASEFLVDKLPDDKKEREAFFSGIIMSGDRAKILWLIKTLSLLRLETVRGKKKMYALDERSLEAAEKTITEEFAFVLGIEKDDVLPYILKRVEQLNAGAVNGDE